MTEATKSLIALLIDFTECFDFVEFIWSSVANSDNLVSGFGVSNDNLLSVCLRGVLLKNLGELFNPAG